MAGTFCNRLARPRSTQRRAAGSVRPLVKPGTPHPARVNLFLDTAGPRGRDVPRQQLFDTVVTRRLPAVTTVPADEATPLSVPPFRLLLAALRLVPRPDKAVCRSLIWVEYWPAAADLSMLSCCSIFVSWAEIAEMPLALTFVVFRSVIDCLRLVRLVQTADLVLPLTLTLLLGLLLPLVLLLLLLVLQAVRNAAAIAHTAASALHRHAIMPAECVVSRAGRVTRSG